MSIQFQTWHSVLPPPKHNNIAHQHINHLLHFAQYSWLRHICHVDEDIICRVAVERSTQALLVKVVSNETDATAKHEQAVKGSDLLRNH